MNDDVQIKQFDVADRDALFSFLCDAYADEPRRSELDFWTWHFLENPNTQPDNIPIWIVKSGELVVGHLAAIPVTLRIADGETSAIWIVDFIVSPLHRGKGLGKLLVLAAKEFCPTMIALGVNYGSRSVFSSANWVALGGTNRFHKLLYPGNAFGVIARNGAARKIANLIYAPFRRRLIGRSMSENDCVRPVTRFDASFDNLWKRAGSQWNCAVVREPRYLEWQFIKQPGKKFEILGCYEDDKLVGYIVLFFRKPASGNAPAKAAITDLIYDAASTLDVIDELLKAAIRLALERNAGTLVTDVLDQKIESRLKHFGFWRSKTSLQFMAITNAREDLVYNAGNWFLTRADSDTSIFEEPNL